MREMPAPMPKVLKKRRHAGGHGVAGAVALRATGRRQHPDAARRHPRRRRRRRRRAGRARRAAHGRRRGPRFVGRDARRRSSPPTGDAIEVDISLEATPVGAVRRGGAARRRRGGRAASRPTAGRSNSSRTSTATASRSWRSAPRSELLAAGGHSDRRCRRAARSRADRRRRTTSTAVDDVHRRDRQAPPLRERNRSAARLSAGDVTTSHTRGETDHG